MGKLKAELFVGEEEIVCQVVVWLHHPSQSCSAIGISTAASMQWVAPLKFFSPIYVASSGFQS